MHYYDVANLYQLGLEPTFRSFRKICGFILQACCTSGHVTSCLLDDQCPNAGAADALAASYAAVL